MNLQNLQHENDTLLIIKKMDNIADEMKIIQPLNLRQKIIKPNLCYYSDAYILVTRDVTSTGGNANTKAEFKNCAPFRRCVTHINDEHIKTAENLDIIIPTYNYADSSGSLWQFKRDEQYKTNTGIPNGVTTDNSTSFKYRSSLLKESTADGANRKFKDVKVVVPLKYLSNFVVSFEMPLINCKIHLKLSWTKDCVMPNIARVTTLQITNTKL